MRRLLFVFPLLLLRGVSAYGQTTTTTLYVPPSYPQNLQVHTITCGAMPTVRLTWNASTPGTYPIAGYLVYLWNGHSFVPDNCNTGGCPGGATHSYSCCTGSPNAGILYINGTFPCNGSACSFTETLDFPGWPYYAVVAFDGHGLTPNPFSQTPSVCTAPDINGGSPGVCGPHLFDGCTPYPCFQCTYNGTDAATSQSSWCNPSASQKCDDCSTCVVTTTTVATTTTTLAPSACDNPTVIASGGGTFSGTTSGTDPLRPSCGATNNSGAKVFQWTPAVSGTATLQTCGPAGTTNYDTVLSLRAGACRTGSEVAGGCNDDFCACASGCAANNASKITPTVTAGQTYYAIVDGAAGRTGNFTLTVTPPTTVTTTTTSGSTTTTLGWAQRFGGSSFDAGNAVAVDSGGNVLMAGSFAATVDFGTGPRVSAGGADLVVAKYTPSGAPLWVRTVGGTGSDQAFAVAVDTTGNVFVGGFFQGTVDFGSGSVTAASNLAMFVAKYNGSNGSLLWLRQFSASVDQRVRGLAVDATGNVVATGYFNGTINFGGSTLTTSNGVSNVYLVTLAAADGAHVWSQSYLCTGNAVGYGVALDSSGNVFVTGSYNGNIDFGGGFMTVAGGLDVFVAKLTGATGAFAAGSWEKRFGDVYNQEADGIAVDSSGNPIVTGYFISTINFGGGVHTGAANHSQPFVAKLSGSDGSQVWADDFVSGNVAGGTSVALSTSGNPVVTGGFQASINLGSGPIASNGLEDVYVAKLGASNGVVQWARTYGGSNNDVGNSIAADGTGNVFLTGSFQNTMVVGASSLTSAGGTDIFLLKVVP